MQKEIVRDALARAGLASPDRNLPPGLRVRHGRNGRGRLLHFYLNFSGLTRTIPYAYASGLELVAAQPVASGAALTLAPWGVAVIGEGR